LAAELIV